MQTTIWSSRSATRCWSHGFAPFSAGRSPDELGDLQLDSRSRRVWRDGRSIELTTREFDVLEFFVRRPETVLSKADILDGVWADDFDGDPNIVEVYVDRLRRKVDDPFDRSLLVTVRGAGYRLEAGS